MVFNTSTIHVFLHFRRYPSVSCLIIQLVTIIQALRCIVQAYQQIRRSNLLLFQFFIEGKYLSRLRIVAFPNPSFLSSTPMEILLSLANFSNFFNHGFLLFVKSCVVLKIFYVKIYKIHKVNKLSVRLFFFNTTQICKVENILFYVDFI